MKLMAAALAMLASPALGQSDDSPITAEAPVPQSAQEEAEPDLDALILSIFSGESRITGDRLDAALEQAAAHPLGSEDNPVRAHMPEGQRAYLSRLRCADGAAPGFLREGSVGAGPFGNIVDLYRVTCEGSEPAEAMIYMDMYHRGHAEQRPVAGFAISGG